MSVLFTALSRERQNATKSSAARRISWKWSLRFSAKKSPTILNVVEEERGSAPRRNEETWPVGGDETSTLSPGPVALHHESVRPAADGGYSER